MYGNSKSVDIELMLPCFLVESMVVYLNNGSIVVGGQVQPDRQTINGCTIPPGYVCAMVTTTHPNQTASLTLGDKSENYLLERGKFFCITNKILPDLEQP